MFSLVSGLKVRKLRGIRKSIDSGTKFIPSYSYQLIYLSEKFGGDKKISNKPSNRIKLCCKIKKQLITDKFHNFIFQRSKLFSDFYTFMRGIMDEYGRSKTRISRFWVGNQVELNIDDPKHIETILTSQKFISKSSQYGFLNSTLGDGLLFSTNKKWFARRRIITPTFHFKILEQFFDVFVKHNQRLLEKLEMKANEEPFDIFPLVTASVMNALCGI